MTIAWFFPLIIFAASLFLFYPSLNYYFFQDDWFVLNWVKNADTWSLFGLRPDIIYWRPISMPLFFKFTNTIFGLNPLGFHLIGFFIHLINSALVYILFRKLAISTRNSLLASFIYATAAFHFVPLSWASTTSYIIGPTFILSTIILFLRGKIRFSFISFILGLTSQELTLTVIPILLVIKGPSILKKLLSFIILALTYVVFRLFIVPAPTTGAYEMAANPQVVTNLFWYLAWIFNMPERLSTIFYFANIPESIKNTLEFWRYFIIPLILMASFGVLVIFTKAQITKLAQGLLIFLAGILPVLFLPKHVYPMYLVIASLGIIYITAASLDRLKLGGRSTILVGLLFFASSYLTLSFTRQNHWVVNQQAIAKAYSQEAKKAAPDPPPNSVFLIRYANREFSQKHNFVLLRSEDTIRQSLNDQDALQVIYSDKTMRSLFERETELPRLPEGSKVFEIAPGL